MRWKTWNELMRMRNVIEMWRVWGEWNWGKGKTTRKIPPQKKTPYTTQNNPGNTESRTRGPIGTEERFNRPYAGTAIITDNSRRVVNICKELHAPASSRRRILEGRWGFTGDNFQYKRCFIPTWLLLLCLKVSSIPKGHWDGVLLNFQISIFILEFYEWFL